MKLVSHLGSRGKEGQWDPAMKQGALINSFIYLYVDEKIITIDICDSTTRPSFGRYLIKIRQKKSSNLL